MPRVTEEDLPPMFAPKGSGAWCAAGTVSGEEGVPKIEDVKLKPANLIAMPIPTVKASEAVDGFHTIHDAAIDGRVHTVAEQLKQGKLWYAGPPWSAGLSVVEQGPFGFCLTVEGRRR